MSMMIQNSKKPQSITLNWSNLNVKVKEKKNKQITQKTILHDSTGYCMPGQMLAIMGASGAGKTTLLSLIAGKRSNSLIVSGQITANNTSFTAQQFYNFGVYIYQNDILHQMLTVKQTLEFIAKLRIKDQQQSILRVKQMISIFELQKCQNVYVGGQFKKGISGGEKKRLCIAVEMIGNPQLLVLDQPTSGLDSSKARVVVKVLRKLVVEQKKTVVFTLHQPSFLIYEQLDRLILLDKGKTVYQGKSKQIYNYMTSNLKMSVPLDLTISDFFMMQISQYKKQKLNHTTCLTYQNYTTILQPSLLLQKDQSIQSSLIGYPKLQIIRSFFFMFSMLMWRQWIIFKRNPMKGARVIMNSVLLIILAGLIFLNGVSDGRPNVMDTYPYEQILIYFIKVQGVTFVAVVCCIMTGLFSVSLAFPNDREIYYKQTTSKKYNSLPYLISKIIIQAGSVIIGTILFAVGIYYIVGYTYDFDQLAKYVITLVVCSLVGNSLGIMTGSIFKDAKRASAMTPLLLLPMMMFSGLYNKLNSIPEWIGWLQYISPFRYGLQAVLENQFNDELINVVGQNGVMMVYNYKQDLGVNLSYEVNIFILLGLSVFYYIIALGCLKKLSSNLAP